MVLTRLQKEIMASIAKNRSESSYLAGGLVLNMDWPRISDDIDIFHDSDQEIAESAERDLGTLKRDGFTTDIDVMIYGCVEATITKGAESTLIQWMSETRTRFFPLVRDPEWGARLHHADLAVNKVLAAATRTKPRDYVDLVLIEERFCPLGAVIMAASGKPPHYSPLRIIDEIRRRGLSVATEDLLSVRGLPAELTAEAVREKLTEALDRAETYLRGAPADLVGLLAVDHQGIPITINDRDAGPHELRKATSEPELAPTLPDAPQGWEPQA
jgi:hypothetical protein